MTEENYETAHVLLHDIKKLEAIKAKIARELGLKVSPIDQTKPVI